VEMKNLAISMTVVSSLAFAGCSSSSNPASPVDSGVAVDSSSGGGDDDSSAVVADSGSSSLYTRLGGHAGIRGAIDAIVGKELADPDIVTYFFNQVAMPIPAGHPTADQIEECFTDLLGHAAGGPEVYPPVGGVTTDAGTFMCRDLGAIHQPLLISGGTFTKFISIAATELGVLGVSMTDIGTIGTVLTATEPAIVSASLADAGLQPYPGSADSDGGPADAGGQ
jgi:hypothetical protein